MEYRRRYYMAKYDEMIEDWQAALGSGAGVAGGGRGAGGYWGLSMGTRFGLPLTVAEPRIRAAVLGLFGVKPGCRGEPAGVRRRAEADGARVLFLQQLGDQQIERQPYADLFDLLGPRTSDCTRTWAGTRRCRRTSWSRRDCSWRRGWPRRRTR